MAIQTGSLSFKLGPEEQPERPGLRAQRRPRPDSADEDDHWRPNRTGFLLPKFDATLQSQGIRSSAIPPRYQREKNMKRTIAGTAIGAAMAVLVMAGGSAQAQDKPNILVIWGDDIGQFNVSAYQPRHDGLPDAQYRQHRRGRRAVHRLVRPAELHRRPRRLHHRPVADPHRPDQGRPARRAGRHEDRGPDHRHPAQAARLRDRASSARTISATATTCCRPTTVSTSSSAISTTSTPRKSRRTPTIRRAPNSRRSSARAA